MARQARPPRPLAARAVLAWALVSFVTAQVAFAFAVDRSWPALRYPEYGCKLESLAAQIDVHRSNPVLLAIGTSRTAFGFYAAGPSASRGWQFNFALTGIGPVQELACLKRLLKTGVRPARVLIEIHPAFLHQTPEWCETRAVDVRLLDCHDLVLLCRYAYCPSELAERWLMSRLSAWHSYRVELLRRLAPSWLPPGSRRDEAMLADTDSWGWSRFPVRPVDEAERRSFAKRCGDLYVAPLTGFEVSHLARQAIDEMLAVCHDAGIEAALVLMPEGEDFRRRYPHNALRQIDRYLDHIRQETATPVFDCRAWCDDVQFCDGQHLLPEGAQAFTAQLIDERLLPWLAESRRLSLEVAHRPRDKDR
ncbi:MAG TPA: hypothetical protein VFI31_19130 [Pirellulales bacterium]|nr:hypothetical protein [Pirellulales bacterium]